MLLLGKKFLQFSQQDSNSSPSEHRSGVLSMSYRRYVTVSRILTSLNEGAFVWEYSGIGIYSGIYSGYSAPGSRIAGMEIQVFRNRESSQTNANLHYSNYSYSGLIPNERALNVRLRRRYPFSFENATFYWRVALPSTRVR